MAASQRETIEALKEKLAKVQAELRAAQEENRILLARGVAPITQLEKDCIIASARVCPQEQKKRQERKRRLEMETEYTSLYR